MIFGRVALAQAQGGILAHNLQVADRVLRKGVKLDEAACQILAAAGHNEVVVARLEDGDMPEGQAAARLGDLLLAPDLRRSADVHGRVNLFAGINGLLRLDGAKIGRLNAVDESVTLATLADGRAVREGDMIATLKIIPFAVAAPVMARAEAVITQGSPAFVLKPFRRLNVALILTRLPQLKAAVLSRTIEATEHRVAWRGGALMPPVKTPHQTAPLAVAIQQVLAGGAALVLISGASAVTDRLDIAPAAIAAAGGVVSHFGMPVDPGNLICFGRVGDVPVIILPGCARSKQPNGIDLVLDRIFAGETLGPAEIAGMGIGGLLAEIKARPSPRAGLALRTQPHVAAVVLAAGASSRMGTNKLLAPMPDGGSMIGWTVDHVLAAGAAPVLVVTGHQAGAIRHALAARPVRFVHATAHGDGMAASLRAGIAALSEEVDAALICLGDMPLVGEQVLRRLIAEYAPAESREIVVPVFAGRRGNPVLWGRRLFGALLALTGDTGGKQILAQFAELVSEVAVPTESVLLDFDTPESLAALWAK